MLSRISRVRIHFQPNLLKQNFNSRSLAQSRNNSMFGWNLFNKGKKEVETSETAEAEEVKEVSELDWSTTEAREVGETLKVTKLSKDDIKQVITEICKEKHPNYTQDSDIELLSLADPKTKFTVLRPMLIKFKLLSGTNEFQLPNRNLNNIESVKELFEYYLQEKDQFKVDDGYKVEQFFEKLEEFPSNLKFEKSDGPKHRYNIKV